MSGATTVRDTEAVAPRMGRPFAWLFHACAGSNLADGIYQVALPIAAVHIGRRVRRRRRHRRSSHPLAAVRSLRAFSSTVSTSVA